MCIFFSTIVTRPLDIFFTEEDHHEKIIKRKGLIDKDLYLRNWVRIEYVNGVMRVDETSVPAWFTEQYDEILGKMQDLFKRVAPLHDRYDETCASARKLYDETCAPAWKLYDETCASARKLYDETCDSARKLYYETCASAQKLYYETCASAQKLYIKQLSTIEGYLPHLDS